MKQLRGIREAGDKDLEKLNVRKQRRVEEANDPNPTCGPRASVGPKETAHSTQKRHLSLVFGKSNLECRYLWVFSDLKVNA